VQLPAALQVKAVVVPGAYNFSQVVHGALAQRLAIVGAGILYSIKGMLLPYQTYAFTQQYAELWHTFLYPCNGFFLAVKNFYPRNHKFV
jgi:hypothetical protein